MRLRSFIPSAFLLALAAGTGLLRSAATVGSGSLIKGSLPAVYYVGADGKRYVFPNDKTYFTWYSDFSGVTTLTDAEVASYMIGGNVTYRPGTRFVKIQSDPKVYAVAAGGTLRWVKTEAAAVSILGNDWSKKIDDLADSFFVNYKLGADISSSSDYSLASESAAATSINADKGLAVAPPANANQNANANANVNAPVCPASCGLGNACSNGMCQAVPGPSTLNVRAYTVDYADVCFVGNLCTGGDCCQIAGTSFAKDADLIAVRPRDNYLYSDKQSVCGRANVALFDRTRVSTQLLAFADGVNADTGGRINAVVNEKHISGEFTMTRKAGTCSWYMSPDDLRDRFVAEVDSSVDALFITSARGFDFGDVQEDDATNVDQAGGIRGAGYSYVVKEADNESAGMPLSSVYRSAFVSQMDSSVALGITDPNASFVGNHCRDGKKDIDETGTDCGGRDCDICY